MKKFLIKLLLKVGGANKVFRRLAAFIAVSVAIVAPDLDVAQATEVFLQIISGVVLWVAGIAEKQPEEIAQIEKQKEKRKIKKK